MKRRVYLDYAAATPTDPAVLKAMAPWFNSNFSNPSALYDEALIANAAFSKARQTIAKILGAPSDTIIFTASATEANNLALLGAARALTGFGRHIISLDIEHRAVLEPLRYLEREGWKITFVPVSTKGIVQADDIIKQIRSDTVLVSVMYANNEVGSIQPIAEIGRKLLKYRQTRATSLPYFHSDASQAAPYLDLAVEKLHLDLMSICGSKLYGPKGIGALYRRHRVPLVPLMYGGGQEQNTRPGTQNIAGAVGLATALAITQAEKERETKRLRGLAKYFFTTLKKNIPAISLNGPEWGDLRLPNNVHVTFPGLDGETMTLYLNQAGVSAATGSACAAQSIESSHVLVALRKHLSARQSIRFTLGKPTARRNLDYAIKAIIAVYKKLRTVA